MLFSVRTFLFGLIKHGWAWFVLVFLDLADIYQKFIQPKLPSGWQGAKMPSVIFWPIVALGLFWAAFKTYHELKLATDREIRKLKKEVAKNIKIVKVDTEYQDITGTDTPGNNHKIRGKFIKLIILNAGISTLHNCKVWIYRVEHTNEIGEIRNSPQGLTSLQLPWSGIHDSVIDLDHNNPKDVAILYSRENSGELSFWRIPIPNNMRGFFKAYGIYRLYIRVTGEDTPSQEAIVEIKWNGMWDEINAELINHHGNRQISES